MGGKDEQLGEELLKNVDVVSPNQTELSRIMQGDGAEQQAEENKIYELMKAYPHLDILYKQGSEGATFYERN